MYFIHYDRQKPTMWTLASKKNEDEIPIHLLTRSALPIPPLFTAHHLGLAKIGANQSSQWLSILIWAGNGNWFDLEVGVPSAKMGVTASRIPSEGRSDEQTSYVFNFNLTYCFYQYSGNLMVPCLIFSPKSKNLSETWVKNPASCQDQEAFLDSIIADCNDKPPVFGQPRFQSFRSFSARQQLLIFWKVLSKNMEKTFLKQRTDCEGSGTV